MSSTPHFSSYFLGKNLVTRPHLIARKSGEAIFELNALFLQLKLSSVAKGEKNGYWGGGRGGALASLEPAGLDLLAQLTLTEPSPGPESPVLADFSGNPVSLRWPNILSLTKVWHELKAF